MNTTNPSASQSDRVAIPDSLHRLPVGATAVRPTPPGSRVDVTVAVKRRAPLPGHEMLDPLRPAERRYLTRAELLRDHGADGDALIRIRDFARSHGLTVLREQSRAARVTLAGAAGDMAAAFGVRLFDYDHPTLGRFHARAGDLTVPAPLRLGDITAVFGFNNHRALRRAPRAAGAAAAAIGGSQRTRTWFYPAELAAIYEFPSVVPADLAAQTIGLLEFGGGIVAEDVERYFELLQQPAPAIAVVPLDGANTDPSADPESAMEVTLDAQVAGAFAPGARLAVYFSTFDEKGMIDALAAVIEDEDQNDPCVLSINWGWAENQPFNDSGVPSSPSAMRHVDDSLLALANLGVTVCVSTGDDGSEAQLPDGHAHVNYPSTSAHVLAVGGTTLHVHRPAHGDPVIDERVWNNGPGNGGGGGVSDCTPRPAWQQGLAQRSINPGQFAGRATPDVAANADPLTGYFAVVAGRPTRIGGTSASAPLWAALVARLNGLLGHRVGNFNALLYAQFGPAGVLRDIVTGSNDTRGLLNGQFAAAPGWDPCTGWGVPSGTALLAAMR